MGDGATRGASKKDHVDGSTAGSLRLKDLFAPLGVVATTVVSMDKITLVFSMNSIAVMVYSRTTSPAVVRARGCVVLKLAASFVIQLVALVLIASRSLLLISTPQLLSSDAALHPPVMSKASTPSTVSVTTVTQVGQTTKSNIPLASFCTSTCKIVCEEREREREREREKKKSEQGARKSE